MNLLLGQYYIKTRDLNKAELHLRQVLRIFEGSGEKFTQGQVCYYLSKMELMKGRETAYKDMMDKSFEIFNTIGAKVWKGKVEKALTARTQ